jgi:xanthine dehydrogenase FAD-binding subunit
VIESVRIALGPAGPSPLRATRAEAFLSGRLFTPDLLPPVADLVLEEAWLRTSAHRATSEYRRELILPLLERALNLAVRRAATGQVTPEPAEEA